MTERPLISVIVLAYNSARFIRESLDTVLEQTYDPIELIVSDDASGDDTAAIVSDWLLAHGSRFTSAVLIQHPVNTGIAGSCNRALQKATGVWLKLIAADDLLLPHCLEDGARYVLKAPELSVLFSRMDMIDDRGRPRGEYRYPAAFFAYDPQAQLKCLLHRNCLAAPTALMRTADVREVGGFDETYPMMEDLPLWIKMLQGGKKLGGMDTITVRYRVHPSLTYPAIGKRNERYQQTIEGFDRDIRTPLAKRLSPLLYVTVKVDILVDYIVQRPLLYKICLPALWVWARASPYRIPVHKTTHA